MKGQVQEWVKQERHLGTWFSGEYKWCWVNQLDSILEAFPNLNDSMIDFKIIEFLFQDFILFHIHIYLQMHICIFLNAQLSKLLSLILFPCFMLILFSLETAAQTVQVPCPETVPKVGSKIQTMLRRPKLCPGICPSSTDPKLAHPERNARVYQGS